jgi:ribosomal protein S18 acetylase RimI-like enzyme
MTNIRFTNELDFQDTQQVVGVLRSERLWIPTGKDYPRHAEWLGKTEYELLEGDKQAFLASVDRSPCGVIVYRSDPDNSQVVDIRNISITPQKRGILIGSFMLRQVERAAHEKQASTLRVDTKIGNEAMIQFLTEQGYDIKGIEDLYGDGTGEDVVMEKSVQPVRHIA